MSDDTQLENVTKRGPGRPSKTERDARDIAEAQARAAKEPKNGLAPEPDRSALSAAVSVSAEPEPFKLYGEHPVGKLKAMELKRNYRPMEGCEIVGHTVPEVKRKNAAGVMEVVAAARFVAGEMAPPPTPGVVPTSGKIWAGTIIRVPVNEAKTMKANGIAEASLEDDD